MDLHAVDRALFEASRRLNLIAHLNPKNLAEEERAFFASTTYNPQLVYHKPPTGATRERLEGLRIPGSSALGTLFRDARDFLLREIALIDSIGTGKAGEIFLYGTPSRSLVSRAYAILDKHPREPSREGSVTATMMKRLCEQELAQYGFAGWRVVLKPAVAKMNVSPSKRSIIIRGNAVFSEREARGLLVHEIGTHVLRAMNGYRQEYLIFGSDAIPGYLATEEGLAVFNEKRTKCLSVSRLRGFAGRVLAVAHALKGSFRDTYDALCAYFTPKEAFLLAARAKRGIANTCAAGGFVKDHVYLEGLDRIEHFVAHGGKPSLLYAGKIGLEHVHLLDQGVLRMPEFLPKC